MLCDRLRACADMDAARSVLRDARSSYGSDVSLAATTEDVALLTVISTDTPEKLTVGSTTPEGLVERLTSANRVAQALASLGAIMASAAAHDLGTHIPKAPDPTVGTDAFFEVSPGRPADIPFQTGDFRDAVRRVGGSGGDAKRGKATRLLRSRVRFGNSTASFGELVAESDSFRQLLVRVGWPQGVVDAVAANVTARLGGPKSIERVDSATKVILFPLPGGGYRQLSPVTSVALWHELRTRIARGRNAEGLGNRRYVIRRRSVGGTKAQNVAVEASDAGGRMELLLSLPPKPRPLMPASRLAHRLKTTGSTIVDVPLDAGLIDAIRRLSFGPKVNIDIRLGRERALAKAGAAWLAGATSMATAIEGGLDVGLDAFADPAEGLLILNGYESLDASSRDALAARFGRFLAGFARDVDDPLMRFSGDGAREALDAAIEASLAPGSDEEPDIAEPAEPQEIPEGDGDDEADDAAPRPARRNDARPARARNAQPRRRNRR